MNEQTPSELGKAIEHLQAAYGTGEFNVYLRQEDVNCISLAAKRLKEVEKALEQANRVHKELQIILGFQCLPSQAPRFVYEQLTTLRDEYQFIKKERDLLLSKADAMDLDHKRIVGMSLEMDKLRTEYKNALEALDNGLSSLRHVVTALHANNAISPDARVAINQMKAVLSTPHAIAAMKKGESK